MRSKAALVTDDFESTSWHDCRVYSVTLPSEKFELAIDIDFIEDWHLEIDETYSFAVVPCKLCFTSVSNVEINLSFRDLIGARIIEITRGAPTRSPNGKVLVQQYCVELDVGSISLVATGFRQEVQGDVVRSNAQEIGR